MLDMRNRQQPFRRARCIFMAHLHGGALPTIMHARFHMRSCMLSMRYRQRSFRRARYSWMAAPSSRTSTSYAASGSVRAAAASSASAASSRLRVLSFPLWYDCRFQARLTWVPGPSC